MPVPFRLLPAAVARAIGAAYLLLAVACDDASQARGAETADDGRRLAALRDAGPLPRHWAARLSIPVAATPCGPLDAPRDLRCEAGATTPVSSHVASAGARAATALRADPDADALHVVALVELASGDTTEIAIGRAVSYLEMATRLSPRSAAAHTDLSAALLASAAGRGGARALLGALEAASRAVELTPQAPAALYNRALALDLLGLDGEAAAAWRRYLAVDTGSVFATEARRRLASTTARRPATPPAVDDAPDVLTAFAAREPAEARTFAWERLLDEWGAATLAGDSARARMRLASARAIGDVLARRFGEHSTTDAVRAAAASASGPATHHRSLAALHVRFAAAQRHARTNAYPAADSAFRAILAQRQPSRALRGWATLGHGNALIYQRRPEDAQRIMRALLQTVDSSRYPALTGRAAWISGVLLLREGRTEPGLAAIHRARRLFARAGDRESAAAAVGLEGEAMFQAGLSAAGHPLAHAALRELREYPASLWRHNVLLVMARAAARDGLPRAAHAVEDEDLAVAGAGTRAVSVVEARLARARTAWLAGDAAAARRAIDEAMRALATVPAGDARAQLGRELQMTAAIGLAASRPDSARRLLDSVVVFFAPLHFPAKQIPALVARARASLALRDTASAVADLSQAAVLYDSSAVELSRAAARAALRAQAREVFDALLLLRSRSGRPGETLATLLGRRRPDDRAGAGTGALVAYRLIGDTLLTWVAGATDTTLSRTTVDRARLARTVERARAGLALGADARTLRPHLEQLYDWLVRPVEDRLGPADGIVRIVADDVLDDVPFPALRDARRGAYLVERHATVLATGHRSRHQPRRAPATTLLVADPALDARTFPTLSPLPGARAEVAAIATTYARATVRDTVRTTVLAREQADSARVVRALAAADVVHFAGHAVFDDAEPDRSYLAVGPRGLTARAITALDLRHVRLVVLAACETMRAPDRHGGFAGLSDAFLEAGVAGVVGSLWRVDDAETRPFMTEFHRAYLRSGDGVRALRDAQLAMLRTGQRPATSWAAFRYAGR